jgi:DNA-binding response OmpR family regulator
MKRSRFSEEQIIAILREHEAGVKTETTRDLRQISAGTPIISVTGRSDAFETDFLRMTRELGATRAITKPFEVDEFIALVRRCLAVADWKRS